MKVFKVRSTSGNVSWRSLLVFFGASLLLLTGSNLLAQTVNSIAVNASPKNKVITTVSVGQHPICIAVSPDSSTVYVSNVYDGTVSVIDATKSSYPVKATTTVGQFPYFLAISPDGKTVYASSFTNPGTVAVIDATQSTYPVSKTLTAGVNAYGLTVSPDGSQLFVASWGDAGNNVPGSVLKFDIPAYTSTTIATNGSPYMLACASNGLLDVINQAGTSFLQFVHRGTGKISPITTGGTIFYVAGMTVDPTGAILYVCNQQNYITVCNASNGEPTKTLLALSDKFTTVELGQPAVTPNGSYLYVPHLNPYEVQMINLTTGKVAGSPIPVGQYPFWAQVSPDGNRLYVANAEDNTVSVINITL